MAKYWFYQQPEWKTVEPWIDSDEELWRAMKLAAKAVPDALVMQAKIARRFVQFVAPVGNGCMAWVGPRKEDGYGIFLGLPAHRVSHQLFVGPIFWAHMVAHRCDNRWCVAPEHLYAGSAIENRRDMLSRGRAPHQVHVVVPANENAKEVLRSARLTQIRKPRKSWQRKWAKKAQAVTTKP